MNSTYLGYAAACIIFPMLWGVIVVWISDRIENTVKRRGSKRGQNPEENVMPPLDYHI
jgi:hypothetical protein